MAEVDDEQAEKWRAIVSAMEGTWLQTSTEGDFEEYLKASEMNIALRKVAWAGNCKCRARVLVDSASQSICFCM